MTTTTVISITGTRSLLWDYVGPRTLIPTASTPPRLGDPMEWQQSVLTIGRELCVPGYDIAACLREAALYTQGGDAHYQRIVTSAIDVLDDYIEIGMVLPVPLHEPPVNSEIYLDIRPAQTMTGEQITRYRVAARAGWSLSVLIAWDTSLLTYTQLLELFQVAGQLVGIGGEREQGFGRFRVNPMQDFDLE